MKSFRFARGFQGEYLHIKSPAHRAKSLRVSSEGGSALDFLYAIPAVILLSVALVAAIILSSAGQWFVHHRLGDRDFVGHNEVGGIIITVTGAIYAVILGFLTVEAWQRTQEARELAALESDADIDAWHTVVGLPSALRQHIRADMLDYAQLMVDSEWPLMKRGRFNPDAGNIDMHALDVAGSFVPSNAAESNAQLLTLQQLTILHDARQRRISINRSGVSWFEWLVLLIGAVCIICFCWLFGLRNLRTHLLMTAMVVTMIASTLILLFELQYPFRSDVGVGTEAWEGAIAHIHAMQTGSQMNMR
jgi:hypothetical protein